MKTLTLLAAVLTLPFHSFAEPEIKGTATELTQYLAGVPSRVTVTGAAEVRVPAQRAVLSLKVTTENRSLQEALRANQDIRTRLIDQLRKQGIAADRIQASRFSSTPKPGFLSDKARGYRVENILRITVQDEREFQNASIGIDAFSEVQFAGVDFEYADKEAMKQRAVSQACDNANERRKLYEEKFGLGLRPVSFQEGPVMQRDLRAGNYLLEKYSSAPAMSDVSLRSRSLGDSEAGDPMSSFGEMVYTAQVTVQCTVVPR